GFIGLELFDQRVRLGGVAAAEDRARPRIDEADLVLVLAALSEIGAVAIVDQRKDAAADRDPGLALMAGFLPGGAVGADLPGLLDVEGLSGLVVLQRRALQVHAEFCRPHRRRVGAGAPPDPLAQTFRMR